VGLHDWKIFCISIGHICRQPINIFSHYLVIMDFAIRVAIDYANISPLRKPLTPSALALKAKCRPGPIGPTQAS
ncbi:MAG: hypothetical protein WCE32_08365, partial [Pseudolabrys sp.]